MKFSILKKDVTKALCFILVFSVIFCCLFGCGKDEGERQRGDPVTSSSVASDDKSGEDSSSGDASQSGGEISSEDGSATASKTEGSGSGTGTKSTKKTSSGGKTSTKSNYATASATKTSTTKAPTPQTTKSNTYYAPRVLTNTAPGTAVRTASDGTASIDYSNAAQGYVMIKYSGSYSNVRILVYPPGSSSYINYPLFSRNTYAAIPLTSGSGTYRFQVVGNSDGSGSYWPVIDESISVSLSYSTVAYSRPNIIVDYNSGTSCVNYAAELTRGCDTDLAKITAIYNYVVKNFSYDYGKASSVANTAYIPSLNSVWSSKSGICYDYAATMAAMLRTQNIPTRVEVGYVSNGSYHAWISVYTKEYGWVNDIIQFNGSSWRLMDPTFASTGGDRDWSKKYSYSVKYYY